MARTSSETQGNGSLSHLLLRLPLGVVAIGVSLWLISVLALLGGLALLVLRPSLVFTSDSAKPSVSEQSEPRDSLAGISCSFPNLEE
jgi:hypothetical protein